jgi:DNA-binding NarL/FixJ family response regulator
MNRKKTNKRARVLIVDDHPAVREALANRIGRQSDLEVCGQAAGSSEAFRLIADTQPDVVVLDISLKTGNGLDLIDRIQQRNDPVRVLVWSMHSESIYAERALRAGAMGYITKDWATDQVVGAIRHVLQGKVWLSKEMADRLLQRAVGVGRQDFAREAVEILARRELEVFLLIGQGKKTADIADHLHLSIKTVETYRDRIRRKLDLNDGTELLHYATQWTLGNG